MRCDGQHREDALTGSVVPEDSVGTRRMIFDVSLKDFFAKLPYIRVILVGVKSWVPKIRLHQSQSFLDLRELLFISSGESYQCLMCLRLNYKLTRH